MNRTLWIVMEDDIAAARLIQITRRHVNLALEYRNGNRNCTPEWRKAIRDEIEQLRTKRDRLLKMYDFGKD